MKKVIFIFILIVLSPCLSFAAHLYPEKEYQKVWCTLNDGVSEYVLTDKARVDCVTKDYAIEFDFANKWAEAVGQSLYYGVSLGKQSGIVLILENSQRDKKYLNRLLSVAKLYNIKVWIITPEILVNRLNCDN